MSRAISIIVAIVILSILIIVHEFGHYLLARKNGVFVKEFSIGFGPRIFSRVGKKTGTRFSLKALPFGGSCMMLGSLEDAEEDDEDDETDGDDEDAPKKGFWEALTEKSESAAKKQTDNCTDQDQIDERSYDRKSVWARMSITLAGPIFNFLLAFVVAVVYVAVCGYDPATVTSVTEGSAAYEAGLREGDVITKYDGTVIDFGREIYLENYITPVSERLDGVNVSYIRDGKTYETLIVPQEYSYYLMGISYYSDENVATIEEVTEGSAAEEAGLEAGDIITSINGIAIATGAELGDYFTENALDGSAINITFTRRGGNYETTLTPVSATAYALGFSYNLQNVKTDALGTLKYSLAELKYEIVSVYKSLAVLFSPKGSLDMLSGPVGIVDVISDTYTASASYGFLVTLMNLLSIMMLLSANLGVINLLPLPALDGGKFVLLIIEAIIRKPVPKKVEGIVTVIGALLLVALALAVLVNDITNLF